MTVSYTKKDYVQTFLSDQAFSYKWCCLELELPKTAKDCFFSLFQMNDRFMDDFAVTASDDYQYGEMQFILTKILRVPVKADEQETKTTGECAFIDGVTSDLYPSVHLKVDKMTAGKYLCFYTCKFKKNELCRKLNVIFYAKHEAKMRRISARKFGSGFLDELARLNWQR